SFLETIINDGRGETSTAPASGASVIVLQATRIELNSTSIQIERIIVHPQIPQRLAVVILQSHNARRLGWCQVTLGRQVRFFGASAWADATVGGCRKAGTWTASSRPGPLSLPTSSTG